MVGTGAADLKKLIFAIALGVLFSRSVLAADYIINFGIITDFEVLRPLVDLCTDFGALERYRNLIESTGDLESLRELLENFGNRRFSGCPKNLAGTGITHVPEQRVR
jgi:hypothetical protein